MAEDAKTLLLQVDANVELARRSLASLERDVGRTSARIDGNLRQAEAGFARMGAAAATARNLVGGFIAGIGVQGGLQLGKAVLDLADDIESAANKASISVERYQSLSEAFRVLEIDADAVDPILKRLNATLGQVQNGTDNGATKALERMGVSAKVLSGEIKTADQLLDAIADSSKTAGSEAQYAADLVEVLGRRYGVDLAAALRNGGAELKAAEADIKSAGGVISELAIHSLAEANERIDKFVARAKIGFVQFVGDALAAFERVDREIDAFIARGVGSPSGVRAARDRLAQTPEGIQELIDLEMGKDARDRDENALFTLRDAKRRMVGARKAKTAAGANPPADIRPPVVRASRTGPKPREFDPFFTTDVSGVSADLARAFKTRFDQDPLIAAMLEEKGGKTLEDRLADIDTVESAEIAAIKKVREANAEARAEAERFFDNVSRNIGQAIIDGQSLGKALVNAFKAAAAEAIASGLFDLLKQIGSSFSGGGSGGSGDLLTSIGAAFGFGAAGGGDLATGRINVVGERGWELAVPKAPTSVLNQAQLRALGVGGAGGAGMTVHQHFHNRFDVGLETVDSRIMQAAPIFKQQALAGVKEAESRRGSFRR